MMSDFEPFQGGGKPRPYHITDGTHKFNIYGRGGPLRSPWVVRVPWSLHSLCEDDSLRLRPYPIDMFAWLDLSDYVLDEAGVPYSKSSNQYPPLYHPTTVAQYGLGYWNAYLASGRSEHKAAFLAQTSWLLAHEVRFVNDASGWPVSIPLHEYHAPRPWLSALTQGNVLSVLVHAYQLTGEELFLQAAQRAVHAFELDILDGGVGSQIGVDGVFFEEVVVYPAAHILKGHLLALLGLYDYVTLTNDPRIEVLIQHGLDTLHGLVNEFDTGYWTRADLLYKRLASRFYQALHVALLAALADYSGCEYCMMLARRWSSYQRSSKCRLLYQVTSHVRDFCDDKLKPALRHRAFGNVVPCGSTLRERVCVPITAFPVAGGMRSVLAGAAQVIDERWQMTYLTHHLGQGAERLEVESFGGKMASPWQFPWVWFYCLAGCSKLFRLLHHHADFTLILPQDGVFSGAFAGLVGKMVGGRVICMDHGNVTMLDNPVLRQEWIKALQARPWYRQLLSRLGLACYWPSLRLLRRIATRCADQFLVAGDEVEAVYRTRLGVHPSRIIRYPYMVDPAPFAPPDKASRVSMRTQQGLSEDAIVISMINRLAPEKGLHFALEGIASALAELPPGVERRLKVLIAGDGPLRAQVAADIQRYGLDDVCVLWGEAQPADVVMLLGISDIFLYSGTRGTNYSMAVLEAMAAGCVVVATIAPPSNARLLAEGRGIPIAPGSASEISAALTHLCGDLELCRQMGQSAREYIGENHSALTLKRCLLRASFFAPSIEGLSKR